MPGRTGVCMSQNHIASVNSALEPLERRLCLSGTLTPVVVVGGASPPTTDTIVISYEQKGQTYTVVGEAGDGGSTFVINTLGEGDTITFGNLKHPAGSATTSGWLKVS